jgi:hypothetical protein
MKHLIKSLKEWSVKTQWNLREYRETGKWNWEDNAGLWMRNSAKREILKKNQIEILEMMNSTVKKHNWKAQQHTRSGGRKSI